MTLTKHDIAEYYADPHVREAILAQIQNRPILAVNKRDDLTFVRRNAPDGHPIKILRAKNNEQDRNDLAWYTARRYAEFHPTIGRKTRLAWVDIDPGTDVPFENVKELAAKVLARMQQLPEVKNTNVTYSGGRGFHVRGELHRKMPTDAVRAIVNAQMDPIKHGPVVNRPPGPTDIRLDTSTLQTNGALRAMYSLNSETGRVAVPLTERELRSFQPYQADIKRILKEKEYAPGIPRSRRMYALPESSAGKDWTLVVQEHDAKRAGLHWDIRLVDPATSYGHSWAIPKASWPAAGEKLLAVRTPTHTAHYSLTFGADGPQQIGKGYGSGTVRIVVKEPVRMDEIRDDRVKFTRITATAAEQYTLVRTQGDKWLLMRTSLQKEAYILGYESVFNKLGFETSPELGADKPPDTAPVASLLQAMDDTGERLLGRDPQARTAGGVNETPMDRKLGQPAEWGDVSAGTW